MPAFVWEMLGLAASGLILVVIAIISLTRRYGLDQGGYLVPTKVVVGLLIVGLIVIILAFSALAIFNRQRAAAPSSQSILHPGPQVITTAGPFHILHLQGAGFIFTKN